MQTNDNQSKTPPNPSFQRLMRRLSQAGFDREFVRKALLPEWWDEDCDQDFHLMTDLEIRVARFLGMPLGLVQDTVTPLALPEFPGISLRRVRKVDGKRLKPAIHLAVRIAEVVVHNLRQPTPQPSLPPVEGNQWRKEMNPEGNAITLDHILDNLWIRGIPVVPLEAIACVVDNDEPGHMRRVISPRETVVPNTCEEGIVDDGDIEADQYARNVGPRIERSKRNSYRHL